ncbi:uncharacterized protein LOC124129002 isoform X2 [Haliotis rufescens]|uniref:uncharacterized protein LOC124129002 isoform X2 n=1 Tax=Haliotis rufescens TaxID=6454 RepID=UPI001EAFC98D|nr:uncharacterized protein LOC124129002 isoform X2 [Haliotis rufescens]
MFIETLEFTIPVELCNIFSSLQKGPASNVEFPASVNSYGTTQDASVQVVLRSNKLTFKVDGVSSNASMISKSECKTLKLSVFDVDRTLMPQENDNDNYNANNMSTVQTLQQTVYLSNPAKRLHESSVSMPQPASKSSRTSFSESPRPRSPVHAIHRRPHSQASASPSNHSQQSKSKNDSQVNVKQEPEDPDLIEIEPDPEPNNIVPKKETPYMQIDYSSDVPHTQTSQAALERLSHPQSSHSQSPGSSSSSFHQNVPHVPDYAEPSTSQARYGDQSADDFLVFQDENDDGDDNEADYSNDGHLQSPDLLDPMSDALHLSAFYRPGAIGPLPEPVKRKNNVRTIETKYFALLEVDKGEKSKSQIAREVGIPSSTLSSWIKDSDRVKTAYLDSDFVPTRKRMRSAKYEDVDSALYQWYRNAVMVGIPLSGPVLLEKAREIASHRGYTDFLGSFGWLERFKGRHGISLSRKLKAKDTSIYKNQTFPS